MDEDKIALVEKIIKDIDNVMSKNAELCSFEIVPAESNTRNKSPVLHFANALGLQSWCVKDVYMYCYNEFMDKYASKPKRRPYKATSVVSDRLTKLLNVALLLNPDLSSLWNKRREMILDNLLEMSSEFQFTKIVLSRKAKCNDAYAYRRWLFDGFLQDETHTLLNINNLIEEEVSICELASDQSRNNYHSWNHRMWVLNRIKKYEDFNICFLYLREYNFSEHFCSKHVSDYSCFHYRQFCIKNMFTLTNDNWLYFDLGVDNNLRRLFVRMLISNFPKDCTIQKSEKSLIFYPEDKMVDFLLPCVIKNCKCSVDNALLCKRIEILFYELNLNSSLQEYYKYHETLWYHRKFVVHEIMSLLYEYYGLVRQNGALVKNYCKKCYTNEVREKQPKSGYDVDRVYSSVLFKVLLTYELRSIEDRKIDKDKYADRYENHLKIVEGLSHVM